jgi:threonyl-tRNA synthetase
MITLTLPPDTTLQVDAGTTAGEALVQADKKSGRQAVAAKVDGEVVDLSSPIAADATVEPVLPGSPEALEVLRHTTAHVMAQAVARHFGMEEVEFAIGPVIADGFYYDFELPRALTDEDLPAIEKLMGAIRKENLPIVREEARDRDHALEIVRGDRAKSRFKQELIGSFPADETVSFYRQGEFMDLCRGPHLPSTSRIAFFKLMSVAGAYWRGDAKREQLQRIYATAFFDKKELKEFLHLREEAAKRDHRKLGPELGLFRILPEAPGFPFWMPAGTVLFNELVEYMRGKLRARGYGEIRTPHIMMDDLWKRSGHYDHYRENMYFTEIEDRSFAVKPMNCPGAALAYKQGLHSYRELPLRYAEFGLCHRHEASGALSGLTRVRSFVQDDAHHFCTPEEIRSESLGLIDLVQEVYGELGFDDLTIFLSTRPEDRAGTDEQWDRAEAELENALEESGLAYEINAGDGAFYGPKIDFYVSDALKRIHQCSTIQCDFSMPDKFDLEYVAQDGSRQRPVMIHRAILGSFERFIGVLIEHYAAIFPLWLAPEQIVVVPVSNERHAEAAEKALAVFRDAGLRARADWSSNKMGKKIREATIRKAAYIVVLGDREADQGTVAVRRRDGTDCGVMAVDDVARALVREVQSRSLTPTLGSEG